MLFSDLQRPGYWRQAHIYIARMIQDMQQKKRAESCQSTIEDQPTEKAQHSTDSACKSEKCVKGKDVMEEDISDVFCILFAGTEIFN